MQKTRLLITCAILICNGIFAQTDSNGSLMVKNSKREFILHLPKKYDSKTALPLVLIFHGGGGNSRQMQNYMKMDGIADSENFITVYPNGINKQWNDGREFKEEIAANDDVQFITQLLDTLVKNYAIDSSRIFATGISNGGFFSIYLSYKLSHRLLAIAPVCASIPERIYNNFYPANPVSLLLINGTKDPLVPYEGGLVGNKRSGGRGRCTSTDSTIQRYIAIDSVRREALIEELPDKNRQDGCTAVKYTYSGGKNNTTVCLIKVINGGHTLPGGYPYLPKIIIGKVCNDFTGNEMIWDFFKNCIPRS